MKKVGLEETVPSNLLNTKKFFMLLDKEKMSWKKIILIE